MGATSRCFCNFASPPAKMHSLQIAYPNGVCNYHKVIVNSSAHFFLIIIFLTIRCGVVYSSFTRITSFSILRSCFLCVAITRSSPPSSLQVFVSLIVLSFILHHQVVLPLCGAHQVSSSIVAPSVRASHLAWVWTLWKCLFLDSY